MERPTARVASVVCSVAFLHSAGSQTNRGEAAERRCHSNRVAFALAPLGSTSTAVTKHIVTKQLVAGGIRQRCQG